MHYNNQNFSLEIGSSFEIGSYCYSPLDIPQGNRSIMQKRFHKIAF